MSLFYPHSFEASITEHDVGSRRYVYTVVFVPPETIAQLPMDEHPRLRVTGEIDELPFEAALTPVGGRWYLLLSKKTLKKLGKSLGDEVTVSFEIGEQDAVDVPTELARALGEDMAVKELWDQQTPGKQRGLAYRVASAKRAKTREKRVAEVFEVLLGKRDFRGRLLS